MAFDPIFRYLENTIIPRNFLQPVPCAYADDFAVAASSFRLLTSISPAFEVVDHTAGLNLNHPTRITGNAVGYNMAVKVAIHY